MLSNYKKRATDFAATAEVLHAKYNRFSFIRLACFLVSLIIIVLLWVQHMGLGLAGTVLFLYLFYKFVQWHQHIKWEEKHNEFLSIINAREVAALGHDYAAFEDGKEFLDAQHPYTSDLDIFGPYSFFQYSNRTSTILGKHRLAAYFQELIPKKEIMDRQEAIADLQDQLDWRQHFQAYGMATEDELQHIQLLKSWLHDKPFVMNNTVYKIAMKVMLPWTIIAIFLWIYYLPWFIALLLFVPAAWIIKRTVDQVNETHLRTTHAEKSLAFYAQLIGHIETGTFKSKKLNALKATFLEEGEPASKRIKGLSYIISQLNVRYNPFAILLNISGLWDLQWVYSLEKWKVGHQAHLPKWFESLQEFEAISSLATVYYNNPEWIFPTIDEGAAVVAEQLGHPLIHRDERVCNDINIPTRGHIKLLTGSNMAGKSTFLRTVGLNIVFGMIGAPACAKRMNLPLLQVYTSMRTQDALHESTSSFYAELKRLKFIIEAVEKGEDIFFLLDEILKGTNSNDRHTGSKALIKQLIKDKGSGIIATHDLELGQLESQYGGAIENLRIEVEIRNKKLYFDYTVKKGVSESFNATLLMQQMGIKIEDG